jgi:hypothetical protein
VRHELPRRRTQPAVRPVRCCPCLIAVAFCLVACVILRSRVCRLLRVQGCQHGSGVARGPVLRGRAQAEQRAAAA